MPTQKCPRILVVDDDLGVIAAYRHVMETSKARKAKTSASATDSLEAELFGNTAPQDTDDIEWRVTFVDQGDDAVEAVRASVATSDPGRSARPCHPPCGSGCNPPRVSS